MLDTIQKDAKIRMHKSVEALEQEYQRMRTGRAHAGLLEHVKIDYYGTETSITQVANVTVSDPRTLTITPWEKPMASKIEKAILESDLGLNPASAGDVIRVPMPALTEERRRDLIKVAKSEAEVARVAIRNIRRDANNQIKELLKDKSVTEDELHRAEEAIQKITDTIIAEVDKILVTKEKDLLAI